MSLFQKEINSEYGYICLWPRPSHGAAEVWSVMRASWWAKHQVAQMVVKREALPDAAYLVPAAALLFVVLSFKYSRNLLVMFYFYDVGVFCRGLLQ